MIIEKKDTHKLYGVPKKIIFCKKCVISNQRPRITFNKFGICSACDYASYKRNKINWKNGFFRKDIGWRAINKK